MYQVVKAVGVVVSVLMMAPVPGFAQQTAPPAAQQQDEQPSANDTENSQDVADNQSDSAAEQAQSDLPDIDNQPIQPGSGGPGRFIPSEQISQDLGVSFPVDI